jgi:hypothetical protein
MTIWNILDFNNTKQKQVNSLLLTHIFYELRLKAKEHTPHDL